MKNTGMLWANDANKDRCRAVVSNLHRMGIINSIVTNYDGRQMPKVRFKVAMFIKENDMKQV